MKRNFFILFLMCFAIIAVIGGSFVHDTFLISPRSNEQAIEIVIPHGSSVSAIATELRQSHLVTHPTFFKWFVAWTHTENKLQAGTFSFFPNTSIASIVMILSNAKNTEVQVTIPEGFTNDQIKAKLAEAFPDFDTVAWEMQTKDLQGYLFPDTYRFAKSARVKEIVDKMRMTLNRRLMENGIDDSGSTKIEAPNSKIELSIHDILTLASLIEKEVQTPEDMKHVAGVFMNRLKIGMPLQTDTSLYTYKNKGLPPEPIDNPGMNAILAVLHPTQTNDLYFITLPDHTAVYARTFEQHIANQRKYLK